MCVVEEREDRGWERTRDMGGNGTNRPRWGIQVARGHKNYEQISPGGEAKKRRSEKKRHPIEDNETRCEHQVERSE